MFLTSFFNEFLLCVCLAVLINWRIVSSQLLVDMYRDLETTLLNTRIPDTVPVKREYDFIVVGAGSAGAAVANRLSELRNFSVLLVEAGDQETFLNDVPLTAGLASITRYNWGYYTERSPNACRGFKHASCSWPRGKGIGGSSLINFMVYSRGHRRDFDNWSDLGNPGWSYDDVLPYFKKSENIGIPELRNSPYHGREGPLNVQYPPYKSKLLNAFLRAGKELGYSVTDPNGEHMMGFSPVQATMRDGRRCSTGKAFVRPIINRRNFDISMKSHVTKIIIDPKTKRATGVQFVKGDKSHVVRAKKEVILCAGAISSPHLLMLSGVGPRQHLEELGIAVVADLKVGYNLQDHLSLAGLTFLVNKPVTIIESEVTNVRDVFQFLFQNRGPYTLPGGAEGYAFIRLPNITSAPGVDENVPNMEIVFGPGSLSNDMSGSLRNLIGITDEFYKKVYANVTGKHSFGMNPILLYPKSRGRISLKSKNPFDWPKMEPNYLNHPDDISGLIAGIKSTLDLVNTKAFQKFDTKLHRTPFLGCEKSKFGTDEYWECCLRNYGLSLQHQSGTCKMGPANDPEAVVNHNLQVYGIQGLRVADASIMPELPAAHTNAIAIMIGEKMADIIKNFHSQKSS